MPLDRTTEELEAAKAEAQPASTHTPAVEARIQYLADRMRRLSFKTGVTVRRCAKEWGYTEQYVRLLSAEASRRVRAELTDPDRVTTTVCAYVEWALATAKKQGEVKAIAPLAKAWAELAGTLVQKHEVTGAVGKLSDEQLAEFKAAVIARLTKGTGT